MKNRSYIKILCLTFIFCQYQVSAQVYESKKNKITFFSQAPLEDIESESNRAYVMADLSSGEVKSTVPISSFAFKKSLMQQHFNTQYMESDKFPYASFTGKLNNIDDLKQQKNGEYTLNGSMTIHGVTQSYTETATIRFEDEKLNGNVKFKVRVDDHDIKIPRFVIRNIAEVIDVEVWINLTKK